MVVRWLWLLLCLPTLALAQTGTTTGALTVQVGLEHLSVRADFTGDSNANNSATIEYKPTASSTWRATVPAVIDRRPTVTDNSGPVTNPGENEGRNMVFGLTENTSYDVRITWFDGDGVTGTNPVLQTVTTAPRAPPLGGSDIWVDAAAPGGGDGSPGSPYNSIPTALSNAVAGDTLRIVAGSYPNFSITQSGTATNWIKLQGETPGSVIIQGGAVSSNIAITGSYLWLTGLEFPTSQDYGIDINGSSFVMVDGNNFPQCSSVATSDDGDACVLTRNAADHIYVLGNTMAVDGAQGAPVGSDFKGQVLGVYTNGNDTAEGTIIVQDNTITGNFLDAIGAIGNFSVTGGFGPNSYFSRNTISRDTNIGDQCIEIEGANINNAAVDNLCLRAREPIGLDANLVGPTYVIRNYLRNATNGGIKLSRGTGHVAVYHNTLNYDNATYQHFGSTDNGSWQNNIWSALAGQTILNQTTDGDDFSYNLFNFNHFRLVSLYNYSPPGGCPASPADFSGVTQFETCGTASNNIEAVPVFADNSTGELAAGSPGIDQAVIIPNVNDALSAWPAVGGTPDMGRLEFGTPAPASTYYARLDANPGNACTAGDSSITGAQDTAQGAVNCATQPGDTVIFLDDGGNVYAETLHLNNSGTAGNPITITVESGIGSPITFRPTTCTGATLNFMAYIPDNNYIHFGGESVSNRLVFDGSLSTSCDFVLAVRNTSANNIIAYVEGANWNEGSGFSATTTTGPNTYRYNYLHDHSPTVCDAPPQHHGIYTVGSNDVVEYNRVENENCGWGIHLWNSQGNTVRYNYVKNTVRDCILLAHGSGSFTSSVHDNVLIDCGQAGSDLDEGIACDSNTGCDDASIYNNTIFNTRDECILTGSQTVRAIIQNNLCLDSGDIIDTNGDGTVTHNGCNAGASCGTSSITISAADFTNTATDDVTLAAGSGAINSGTGATRNGIPDRGAHETFTVTDAEVGTIDAQTIVLTLEGYHAPFLAPGGCTGFTFGGIACSPTCVSVTPQVANTIHVGISCPVTYNETGLTYSYNGTHVTDTAERGGVFNQPQHAVSNFSITNNVPMAATANMIRRGGRLRGGRF